MNKIDRKNLLYCRNDFRRVLLLTERERTYTGLLSGLQIYPADNILCAPVSQVVDGKLNEEIGPVIGIKPAVTVAVILIHRNAEGRVTVIEGYAECENAVALPVCPDIPYAILRLELFPSLIQSSCICSVAETKGRFR